MRMGIIQYQEFVDATKSEVYQNCLASLIQQQLALSVVSNGLCSEVGEVAGLIKKSIEKSRNFDLDKLKEEIGDCFWYLVQLCNLLGVDACDILGENIAKLQARHPNGFNPNHADEGKECGC